MKHRKIQRILRKNKDWDYLFLLKLEYYKLKQMYTYFSKNEVRNIICRDIKLCIKLLEIYFDLDNNINLEKAKTINIRNSNRFLEDYEVAWLNEEKPEHFNFKTMSGNEYNIPIDTVNLAKEALYKNKVWHLYNLIREYKTETWWD